MALPGWCEIPISHPRGLSWHYYFLVANGLVDADGMSSGR